MTPFSSSRPMPEILLILGTDLAGKDYVTNILADTARETGKMVERRRGRFGARPDSTRTSEDKGLVKLGMEWLFLATLPVHYRLLPTLVALLIRFDLLRFRRPADGLLVVVSHTALRLLALSLGYQGKEVAAIRMAPWVERTLQAIVPATGAKVVVLDIEHSIRAERIARRNQSGTLDVFDRYMGRDPERSERIEQILVWLATTYLQAHRVENNNCGKAELLARIAAINAR